MIEKVLIANRGEIAVRVIRACREMDISAVAVYSPIDRASPHVRMSDEAYPLAGNLPAESYLDQGAILRIAQEAGADAIHPGYGFLSENPDFAQACADAGIVFIGPSPECIRTMGDKIAARAMAEKAGVPTPPGSDSAVASMEEARTLAEEIGYPILVKAIAGGGGKGMRLVETPDQLSDAMERAQSESQSAFGDARVFIERYFREVHHIEIQVFADTHGNAVHLFERECSIQRRHQKVLEETPSPTITAGQREQMGKAAVALAKACDYTGAGTVEFLFSDGEMYFIEMNTRLQVEHPVTEMVTGLDLVKLQLQVASGEPLPFTQTDVRQRGHAIECRIYAEDPVHFTASPGDIQQVIEPGGPFVRLDSYIEPNTTVSASYDPLLAKLAVWGPDRRQAIERMRRVLDEYVVTGIQTTIPFHRRLMRHAAFLAGNTSTRFIEQHFGGEPEPIPPEIEEAMLAAIAITQYNKRKDLGQQTRAENHVSSSRWKDYGRFERLCR
jgi:acetyl-CoA carboxylase, biotin carboxylase subunit